MSPMTHATGNPPILTYPTSQNVWDETVQVQMREVKKGFRMCNEWFMYYNYGRH